MTDSHPLTKFREEAGLTQEALAKELGVTGVTISRIETGRRKTGKRLLPRLVERTGIPAAIWRPDLAEIMRPQHEAAQ